jgi:hypothetical protein
LRSFLFVWEYAILLHSLNKEFDIWPSLLPRGMSNFDILIHFSVFQYKLRLSVFLFEL